MSTKTIFNLHLKFEDALKNAKAFQKSHKAYDGKELYIWEDPKGFYNERLKFRTDFFYKASTFEDDVKEEFEIGTVEVEAKAALFWLIDRYKGFNPLELSQVIVGVMNHGFGGDKEVAIFTYISKADDCLRDFITKKAFDLTNK